MCLAKPSKTRGLTGTGTGLARQEAAGRVFGQFWSGTELFFRSKSVPVAGYPDPVLTLQIANAQSLAVRAASTPPQQFKERGQ